jgi:hypothetical protein
VDAIYVGVAGGSVPKLNTTMHKKSDRGHDRAQPGHRQRRHQLHKQECESADKCYLGSKRYSEMFVTYAGGHVTVTKPFPGA